MCDGFIVALRSEFGVQCSHSKPLLPFSVVYCYGFLVSFSGEIGTPQRMDMSLSMCWASWRPVPRPSQCGPGCPSHGSVTAPSSTPLPAGNRMPLQAELYLATCCVLGHRSFSGDWCLLKLFVLPPVATVTLHSWAAEQECWMLLGCLTEDKPYYVGKLDSALYPNSRCVAFLRTIRCHRLSLFSFYDV